MACDVETGNFIFVIQNTVNPAQRATVKAPPIASTDPNFPKVCDAPEPCKKAPKTTNMEAIKTAALNLIIFDPTAEPKIFAASLAPKDQPKNKPLVKKNINIRIGFFSATF